MANNASDSLKMTPLTVIPTAILTDRSLCENSVVVYAYLASRVGMDGSAQFPGYDNIRDALGMPQSYNTRVYIQELEMAGWLSMFVSRKGGVSNRYWLAIRPNDFRL